MCQSSTFGPFDEVEKKSMLPGMSWMNNLSRNEQQMVPKQCNESVSMAEM